jgi:hypothetical protein
VAQYTSLSAALTAVIRAASKATDDDGALNEVAERTLHGLQDRHGKYQPGWAHLAASTIAQKGKDSPRLDTGAHSIGSYRKSVGNREASIGTNDSIELFQEYGTFRAGKPAIPPRPIFPHEIREAATYAPRIFAATLKRFLAAL